MKRLRAIGLACLLALPGVLRAQANEDIDAGILDERQMREVEAGGFIVDRTATNFGAQFVRYFSEAWRELDGTDAIDVTVIERPSARFGSLIWVEHNGRQVVRAFLYAGRPSTIRPTAVAAAQHVAKEVADDSLARALLRDPDMGQDGF